MNSQFNSENDRFRLNSDDGEDAGLPDEGSTRRLPDNDTDAGAADDMRSDDPPATERQLGPISEETKARYSELLIALEQTITQAVERTDAVPSIPRPANSGAFERDAARFQTEALRPVRLPPAASPFAPPKFRSFRPERLGAEPRPLEPAFRSPFPERRPAFEHGAGRREEHSIIALREETISGLRLQTRPYPPAARQSESRFRRHGGRGLLRRIALVGIFTGAIIPLGALYLSYAAHAPNVASASATPSLLQRVFSGPGDRQPAGHAAGRMAVTDLSGPKNRPIALGVSVEAAPQGASIVVKGMPSGSRVTAGAATSEGTWRVPVRDMGRAAVIPPRDYVGTMDLPVDLRLADDTVADSNVLRLEWTAAVAEGMVPKPVKTTVIAAAGNPVPAPSAPPAVATDASAAMAALPPTRSSVAPAKQPEARSGTEPVERHLEHDEIATLLERGQGFLQNGDIAAARLLLRRAADAGHAQAAMALGATYDPAALKELGALGVVANVETARVWYEKASRLGSAEAIRRLQRLAQQSQ